MLTPSPRSTTTTPAEASYDFVLIIGIDAYPYYDGAGLQGSVNDAHWWKGLSRDLLGCPEHNVRFVVSTTDRPGATQVDILEGVAWLAARMKAAHGAGHQPTGLIAYSGHGVATDETGNTALGLSIGLCASDLRIEDGELHGVVSLALIQGILLGAAVGWGLATDAPERGREAMQSWVRDVTVVLDCCYAMPGGTATSATFGLPDDATSFGKHPLFRLDNNVTRTVLACNPWDVSYQLQSSGRWHGAFSFALLTLLEQWKVEHDAGRAWFDVTLQNLINRATQMLLMLGVQQTPVMMAQPRIGLIPFLRPGGEIEPDEGALWPNAFRPTAEIETPVGQGFRPLVLWAYVDEDDGSGGTIGWQIACYIVTAGDSGYNYLYPSGSQDPTTSYWLSRGQEHWWPQAIPLGSNPTAATISRYKLELQSTQGPYGQGYDAAAVDSTVIDDVITTSWGIPTQTPLKFSADELFTSWGTSGPQQPSGVLSGGVLTGTTSGISNYQLPAGFQLFFDVDTTAQTGTLRGVCFQDSQGADDPQFFSISPSQTSVVMKEAPSQSTSQWTWLSTDFAMKRALKPDTTPTAAMSPSESFLVPGSNVRYFFAYEDDNGMVGQISGGTDQVTVPSPNGWSQVQVHRTGLDTSYACVRVYRRLTNVPNDPGVQFVCLGTADIQTNGSASFTDPPSQS